MILLYIFVKGLFVAGTRHALICRQLDLNLLEIESKTLAIGSFVGHYHYVFPRQ